MKRSEAKLILQARNDWSTEYSALSIKQDDAGNDGEAYFDHSGCDICSGFPSGGAGDVFDVIYRRNADIKRKKFSDSHIHEGQLCGDCLCALINDDDSSLDYYVSEEDCGDA